MSDTQRKRSTLSELDEQMSNIGDLQHRKAQKDAKQKRQKTFITRIIIIALLLVAFNIYYKAHLAAVKQNDLNNLDDYISVLQNNYSEDSRKLESKLSLCHKYDDSERERNIVFGYANGLARTGKYCDAIELVNEHYPDANLQDLYSIIASSELTAISNAEINSVVTFGSYAVTSDKYSPIQWYILDKNDTYALLYSESYVRNIDWDQMINYDQEPSEITWQNCNARSTLQDLYSSNSWFSQYEKNAITPVHNTSVMYGKDGNPSYQLDETDDYLYFLSANEAEQYLNDTTDSNCKYYSIVLRDKYISNEFAIQKEGIQTTTMFQDPHTIGYDYRIAMWVRYK